MGVRPSSPAAAAAGEGGLPPHRAGLLSRPQGDGTLLVVRVGVVFFAMVGRFGLVAHAGHLGRVFRPGALLARRTQANALKKR